MRLPDEHEKGDLTSTERKLICWFWSGIAIFVGGKVVVPPQHTRITSWVVAIVQSILLSNQRVGFHFVTIVIMTSIISGI